MNWCSKLWRNSLQLKCSSKKFQTISPGKCEKFSSLAPFLLALATLKLCRSLKREMGKETGGNRQNCKTPFLVFLKTITRNGAMWWLCLWLVVVFSLFAFCPPLILPLKLIPNWITCNVFVKTSNCIFPKSEIYLWLCFHYFLLAPPDLPTAQTNTPTSAWIKWNPGYFKIFQ